MAKIFLVVVLFVFAEAVHKHHPKFPKDLIEKVACTSENERIRNEIIEKSKCRDPKEVFVYLKPPSAHEQVIPSAVWVKRCVGICDYEAEGSSCVSTDTVMKTISIRIYNVKTKKETCSTYQIEEHRSCGCCNLTPEECGDSRIYNPRKCTCQCPNTEERRNCLRKRNLNMRWNRSKCTCEERRRRVQ
ncbi:uncharacterized protein LOC113509117 isoform X1 [Galleria mellonella]|uniref:Uncharacterized protein LOC113509117 isoform X1 n=1 Tax=Galleria mellonella TaxID=7137 RepID=A0A6J1WEL6_GALME|nr:uncharacterized protein LOC113509117 isoform X1 [Galleria mellonella]